MRRIWWVLGLLVVVSAVIVVGFTDVFSAREVEVVGVSSDTATEIEEAAQVPLGRPLARVDTGAIASAVEAGVPGVTSITVKRRWPHTVLITATPRRVVATVQSGGTVRWVDPSGVEFGPIDEPRDDVPSIAVLRRFTDDETEQKQQAVRDGLKVIAALPPQVRKRVTKVELRSDDDIRLRMTPEGVRVRWGSAAESARKAQVLAALLSRKASTYDVSAPDLPTTKGNEPGSKGTND